MLSTAILVFREVLEAALVIGLVAAATRELNGNKRWIAMGLGAGILGAIIIALLTDAIGAAAEGLGQELLNAIILLAAVIMLGWHNVWMRKHAAELTQHVKNMGSKVGSGELPLYALAVVVGLAVLREGAEVVLFLYGQFASGTSVAQMTAGGAMGTALGVVVGVALYSGLMRIPMRHLFSVTAIMLLVLAAGLAAQAAAYLVQADVLPALGYNLWDTSWILSQQSVLGSVLHTLIGYIDRPMGIQLVFYVVTLLVIGGLMRWVNGQSAGRPMTAAAVVILLTFAVGSLLTPSTASATHKIYSPYVELGEAELELRGHTTDDDDPAKDSQEKYKIEFGYGVTEKWFTSVFGEIEEEQPDNELEWEATAWENIFQLTDQGRYFVDFGVYLEYELTHESNTPDKVEAKLLMEKPTGGFSHTMNLIWEHEVGSNAASGTGFGYAWRTKWHYNPKFEPALEIYGDLGKWDNLDSRDNTDQRAGPVIGGEFAKQADGSKWVYELGYLFGFTDAAPDGTLKFLIEYEFRF